MIYLPDTNLWIYHLKQPDSFVTNRLLGSSPGQPVSTESCAPAWREPESRLDHLICKSLRLLFFMIARSLATTRVNFQVSMDCELKIGKPSYVELQQGAVFVTGGVSVTGWVRLNPARSQAIRTIKRCYSPSKVHRKETKTESRKPSLVSSVGIGF